MLNWFKSYLEGRSQYTCINGCSSSQNVIDYGVPQGSVLGPLLFLIFINDIGFLPNLASKPKLFADDTNLFVCSPTLKDLQTKCQNSIDEIADWLLANKLTVNYDKTCYMLFTPPSLTNSCTELDLHINKQKINKVSSTKYLGVIIDENLDWKQHISGLCLELRKLTGIFYKLSLKLPLTVLRTLYFSFVYSRVLYAIEVYANTYLIHLHDLIIINNRILRMLQHKSRFTRVNELYLNYNTLPINKLFQFQILLHAFKLLFCTDMLPNVFHYPNLTNYAIHSHNTRTKSDFHLATFNSIAGSKISHKLCAKFWNHLPSNLKDLRNLKIFARGVKVYLLYNDL